MMNENVTKRTESARAYFLQGYGCAQSVLLAFSDLTGLDEKASARLGSSFGGGMGRLREVCGGVTGAFAVLGFVCGYDDPTDKEGKSRHYADIRELARRFSERSRGNSIICRELLGAKRADNAPNPTPRDAEFYRTRPCARFVGAAAELLERYIAAHSSKS